VDDVVTKLAELVTEMHASGSTASIAILDNRPGRTISRLYRQFLSHVKNGIYIMTPPSETLNTLQRLVQQPSMPLAYDLDRTATILNFGHPLQGNWQAPSLSTRLTGGEGLRIIQVGFRPYNTGKEISWLPVKPGSETALALGLARIIIKEGLYDRHEIQNTVIDFESSFVPLVEEFTPEVAAHSTGLSQEQLLHTARELAGNKPALVLGEADPAGGPLSPSVNAAIAGLNLLLGCFGRNGSIAIKRQPPVPDDLKDEVLSSVRELREVPDHSIGVLVLDAAESGYTLPWTLIERKLIPGESVVVSLSPNLGTYARYADYFVPAPAYLETTEDIVSPETSPVTSFSLAAPLLPRREGVIEPIDFLHRLAFACGIPREGEAPAEPSPAFGENRDRGLAPHLRTQASMIYDTGRGKVFISESGDYVDLATIGGPDELWDHLVAGGCWLDERPGRHVVPRVRLSGKPDTENLSASLSDKRIREGRTDENYPVQLLPLGTQGAIANHRVSPLLSKLFQESDLYPGPNQGFINPDTGRRYGLAHNQEARITTRSGSKVIRVWFDAAVAPGVIYIAVAPSRDGFSRSGQTKGKSPSASILEICDIQQDLTWRITPANVRKA
jgi:anaerobic selenocysteine-containing dehydrogenase